MRRLDGDAYQREYFDVAEHQYPRTAVVMPPPRHTEVESRNVLDRLDVTRGDGPVIDFGAGTGRLSIALARAGHAVLAVDVSDGSLSVLRRTADDLGLHAIETATVLPSAGRYAAIVGSDVLHHVELDAQLPRIYGLLRTGGKVVFSEPGAFNPAWYVYLGLFHDLRVERRIVTCNLVQLRRTFARHGFREVRITGPGFCPARFSGGRTPSADGMTRWATGRCFGGSPIGTSSKPRDRRGSAFD